ncbi:MAG: aminopeptidase [Gammaproteobacteria bacterium]|nr:aminopeptidase [Gammaproteobacteria bacterium]
MIALLAVAFLLLEGCYYMQAIRGHTDLMGRRRPVSEVIEDDASPQELKARLALVNAARDFAVTDLLLPDNDSYRSYADLERDYVVWNVFAAPEFSLQPKTWCYPVAGCVAYRGYFNEDSARKFESKLTDDGFDVAVGGVSAYSTLGRFADPVLNTMMRWTDVDLVSTMFHELAHQKLYIKDDSAFNESFATAVADIGVELWLHRTGELDRLQVYNERKVLRQSMLALVRETRSALDTLYGSELAAEEMRRQKADLLNALSDRAQQVVDDDGSGARNWLAAPLNNARLVSMNLYEGRVAAFRSMYMDCDRALDCFYERVREVSELQYRERTGLLEALAD